MFSIGDFARLGRVSVRMLRHYDAIGLLRPARVDAASGYRFYGVDQLARLNRVVALKELGFTLQQVRDILDENVGPDELRGMLRLRRAQLAEQIAADTARLTQVETRLRLIESEGRMDTQDIVLKPVASVRLAELTTTVSGYDSAEIGPAIQPLFGELFGKLTAAGLAPAGPAVAYYEETADERVVIHAGVPVTGEPAGDSGLAVADLPGVERVAAVVHRGPLDTADRTWQSLQAWAAAQGYRMAGAAREVYLHAGTGDQQEWITEFQLPIAK
jgi:DNA-binding transcriptional MerR regulator/effector-binding domain-containing protein